MFVKEMASKCLQHSDPGIICCTSANPYNKAPASMQHGILYHLAYSICSCLHRISGRLRYKRKSCCLCHLDQCYFSSCFIITDIRSLYGLSKRSGHINCMTSHVRFSIGDRIHGSLSSICNRNHFDLTILILFLQPFFDRHACLNRGHAALKRINSCQNLKRSFSQFQIILQYGVMYFTCSIHLRSPPLQLSHRLFPVQIISDNCTHNTANDMCHIRDIVLYCDTFIYLLSDKNDRNQNKG